jgi:flavin-dependent dehydrogenase
MLKPEGTYPIAIIGGGLAGSAAGAILARAGWRTAIIERDTFPRDKMCGEFLSGESWRLLQKIGCLPELLRHRPPVITHVRFVSTRGREVTITLPEPAYGISRRLLDETLFRHACSLGATGITGCEVQRIRRKSNPESRILYLGESKSGSKASFPPTMQPALTIAAYGRRTKLDRDLERPFLKDLDSSIGLKLHHIPAGARGRKALAELAHTTEVYALNGGYCGLCLVEGGRINVCMLLKRTTFTTVGSARWPDIAAFLTRENPALGKRLAELAPVDEPVLTVSHMPFGAKEQALEDVLFIGDAAGMIVPLCGDGQAMALESGVMLAEIIIAKFPDPETFDSAGVWESDLAIAWQQQWQQKFSRRIRTGRILQHILLRPTLGNLAIAILQHSPNQVKNYLAQTTRSQ